MVQSYRRGVPFAGSPVVLIQCLRSSTATTSAFLMPMARGIFACLATFVPTVIVYPLYSLQVIKTHAFLLPSCLLSTQHAPGSRTCLARLNSLTSSIAMSKNQRFLPLTGHLLACSTTLFPPLQQFLGLCDVLSWYLAVSCSQYVCLNAIHCLRPVCGLGERSKFSGWSLLVCSRTGKAQEATREM